MNLVVEGAQNISAVLIVAEYQPSAKNSIVRDLYQKFGYQLAEADTEDNMIWVLELNEYKVRKHAFLFLR